MSRKKKALEARMGEPLPRAHVERLIASSVEHGKRVVANQVQYPDPGSLPESDSYDPRIQTGEPVVDSQSKPCAEPRDESRAAGHDRQEGDRK